MTRIRCLACGKPGDYYYDGVCHECASRPFGLLWAIGQGGPTREELKVEWSRLIDEAYEEQEEKKLKRKIDLVMEYDGGEAALHLALDTVIDRLERGLRMNMGDPAR